MKLFPLHLLPNDTNIDFMRLRWVSLGIAAAAGAGSRWRAMAFNGFNFALDFTGGTVVELRFESCRGRWRARAPGKAGYRGRAGADFRHRQRTAGAPAAPPGKQAGKPNNRTAQEVLGGLRARQAAKIMRSEFVGPQVGKELALNGLYALIFVVVGFLIYIAFRFEWKFAVAAIFTTLHDVLIVAGLFALTGREFDLTVLAGLLSVMGFSINDTIVVFDRVRENFRSLRVDPTRSSTVGQPDAVAHHHHLVRGVPDRAGAVHLRWRLAGRHGRVADDGHRDRHASPRSSSPARC